MFVAFKSFCHGEYGTELFYLFSRKFIDSLNKRFKLDFVNGARPRVTYRFSGKENV